MNRLELQNAGRRHFLKTGISSGGALLAKPLGTILAFGTLGVMADELCTPAASFDPRHRPDCLEKEAGRLSNQQIIACFNRQRSFCYSRGTLSGPVTMFEAHADWHLQNQLHYVPGLQYPSDHPDPDWCSDIALGASFLRMHRSMSNAINAWYASYRYPLPATWDLSAAIPVELDYQPDQPDFLDFPDQLLGTQPRVWAQNTWKCNSSILMRNNYPACSLPMYFTGPGIDNDKDRGELRTGARRLADFKSIEQLGCCLLFMHAQWHQFVGGVAQFLDVSILDPLFYFGIHRHIEKIFESYEAILAARKDFPNDQVELKRAFAIPSSAGSLHLGSYSAHEKGSLEEDWDSLKPEKNMLTVQLYHGLECGNKENYHQNIS